MVCLDVGMAWAVETQAVDDWIQFIQTNLNGQLGQPDPTGTNEAAMLTFVSYTPFRMRVQDTDGATPMLYACEKGYWSVIHYLQAHGIARTPANEVHEFFHGPRPLSPPSSEADSPRYMSLSPQPPDRDPGRQTPPVRWPDHTLTTAIMEHMFPVGH